MISKYGFIILRNVIKYTLPKNHLLFDQKERNYNTKLILQNITISYIIDLTYFSTVKIYFYTTEIMSSGFDFAHGAGVNSEGGILQETIKSCFLFNFRTGNVVIDTFITGFVIYISTYLMGLAGRFNFFNWIQNLFSRNDIKEEQTRRILVSSKTSKSQLNSHAVLEGNNSVLFNAILHQIKKLDCDKANIFEMSEISVQITPTRRDRQCREDSMGRRRINPNYDGINTAEDLKRESIKRTNLVVSQSKRFEINGNVFGTVRCLKRPDDNVNSRAVTNHGQGYQDNHGPQVAEEFEITIETEVLSMNELRSLVHSWVLEYLQFMEPNDDMFFFQHQSLSKDHMSHYHHQGMQVPPATFSEFRFTSNKTFQNLFFPEKKELIDQLDYFANNEMWYKEKGFPYTLGFLFHGEPGCGKTSTIKAIANHTKRHIVSISLSKIRSQNELFGIFHSEYINDRKIPIHKRLYVIEDIDCNKLEKIVGERIKTKEKFPEEQIVNEMSDDSSPLDTIPNLEDPWLKSRPKKIKIEDDTPKITLADILEALDGVVEMDGRMLVITTNYPEKLDAALTRPGRIDVHLEFTRCSSDTLLQIIQHVYNSKASERNYAYLDHIEDGSLPCSIWTPAEVIQTLIKHIRSPEKGLEELQDGPSNK